MRQGRGSNQIGRGHALAELLEVEEEECLVFTVVQFRNAERSAQREPVVVPVQRVLDVTDAGRRVVRERYARVQSVVLEIVVTGAVELIGARLHGEVDVSAANLAVLSREIAGLDGHFLNGVHTWLDRLAGILHKAVGGVLAFHSNGLRTGRQAVDANLNIGSEIRSRQGVQNRQRVPNVAHPLAAAPVQGEQRDVIRLGVINLMAHFAAFRLQQRSFGVDRDRLVGSSHLKGRIRAGSLGHLDSEARPDILFETRGSHRELIGACRQVGERVIACTCRSCRIHLAGCDVLRLDGGGGDHGARHVQNGTCDSAAISLSKRYKGTKGYTYYCHYLAHAIFSPTKLVKPIPREPASHQMLEGAYINLPSTSIVWGKLTRL